MSCFRTLGLTAFASLATGGVAFADVTPEDVWQNWQALATASGYSVAAATQTRSGDTLVLTDVTTTIRDDGMTGGATLARVELRDRGDGSVSVTMDPEYVVSVRVAEPGSETVTLALRVQHEGMEMVASGSPESMRYALDAPQFALGLEQLVVDGTALPLIMQYTMAGMTGTFGTSLTDVLRQEADLHIDAIAIAVEAEDPEGEGSLVFAAEGENTVIRFNGTVVPGMGSADLPTLLAAGLDFEGGYSVGATSFTFDFADEETETAVAASFASGGLSVAVNAARVIYDTALNGLDLTVASSEIPMPEVNVTLGDYRLAVNLPIAQSDDLADFSVLARLVDLVLPDDIWGMFDPMGAFPRDPATLVLDAKGKVKVLADIMNPSPAHMGEPGELHALELEAFQLRAVGTELTGRGSFTFDNSDTETFDGMPRPIGAIDLMLVGGNALIDKLIQMGMLPQDQAMGARMMMGLFGRPGDGPDTLTSKIEFPAAGGIIANGQRIQ